MNRSQILYILALLLAASGLFVLLLLPDYLILALFLGTAGLFATVAAQTIAKKSKQ